MSPLRILHDDRDDVTVVSNLFIDEYMKDANHAQIKIFLYLIRMIGADRAPSISDIADKFNYPEKDVVRALKYWEKNMLLQIDYDEQKLPVEIRILNTLKQKPQEDFTLQNLSSPVVTAPPQNKSIIEDRFVEPSYSLDDLKTFKEAEETSQLIHVAEQYLQKRLSPNDIRTIMFFSDTLGFSADLIDYLLQYCVERNKKYFPYIKQVAINWAEEGITTPKQAANTTRKYDKIVYDVMKALGKQSNPTQSEADYILRWVREYRFAPEIIYEACERTVIAVDTNRFKYCHKILSDWYSQNVRHKADIEKLDTAFATKRAANISSQRSGGTLLINQFKQHDYDFEALEREVVGN